MKFLIDFVDGTAEQLIVEWLADNGIANAVKLNSQVYIVDTPSAPTPTSIIERITADENISNQLLGTFEVIPSLNNESVTFDNNQDWWKTASAFDIDFTAATTTIERRGAKTNVYIVDSGIAQDHPEFANANVEQLFTFTDDFQDTNGHGTALASVVVGQTLGITAATVKVVKVFDNTKTTMISDLVKAFDAILADIIASPNTLPVINLSWSIAKNLYVESKLQALINAGALVVAAAGNDGTNIQDVTPASMEQVITVGAFTDEFVPADFSNYTSDIKNTEGETNHGALDAWAPGTNIKVASIDGTTCLISGTSIAAAIMTACVAYNSDLLYSDETYTPQYEHFMKWVTLRKKNVLALAGKYAESVNVICSFTAQVWPYVADNNRRVAQVLYQNEDVFCYVAPNAFISRLELDGDLPEGLKLANGWIVGKLTAPAATQSITMDYTATITFKSGSVTTFNITLYLANSSTTPGVMPTDIPADAALLCDDCSSGCEKGLNCYCNGCH